MNYGININIQEINKIDIIIDHLVLSQKMKLKYYKHNMI